jgi:hypothetical protein
VGVVSAAVAIGLSGCATESPPADSGQASSATATSSPGAATNPSASASASGTSTASASPSPSPTWTLTAEEQQAFEEATNTVVAYRQTIVDLYTGARTNLNDLYDVATGELLDDDLRAIQKALSEGASGQPQGAQVVLIEARPRAVTLGNKDTVVIQACVDASAVTGFGQTGKPLLGHASKPTTPS